MFEVTLLDAGRGGGIPASNAARCEPVDVSLALFALFNGIPRWYKSEGRKPAQIADDFLDLVVDGLRPRGGR
jgi:hypothetical protein